MFMHVTYLELMFSTLSRVWGWDIFCPGICMKLSSDAHQLWWWVEPSLNSWMCRGQSPAMGTEPSIPPARLLQPLLPAFQSHVLGCRHRGVTVFPWLPCLCIVLSQRPAVSAVGFHKYAFLGWRSSLLVQLSEKVCEFSRLHFLCRWDVQVQFFPPNMMLIDGLIFLCGISFTCLGMVPLGHMFHPINRL